MTGDHAIAGRVMRLSEAGRWEPLGPGLARGEPLLLGGGPRLTNAKAVGCTVPAALEARPGDRVIVGESAGELVWRVEDGALWETVVAHTARHYGDRLGPDDQEVWITRRVEPGSEPTIRDRKDADIPGWLIDGLLQALSASRDAPGR